jgi:hypothetical protein
MQVNATLIAAQQAAREARDRFQTSHFTPAAPGVVQGAVFTAALEKAGFAPLTLKQTAPASASQAPPRTAPQAGPDAAPLSRPGSWLDIKV